MTALLETRNLTKKYQEGTTKIHAVDHVNLQVDAGDFVMIMGASGSGKTSLLHLLAGIDSFDEGTVLYTLQPSAKTAVHSCPDSADFSRMSETAKTIFRRTHIGIVFQQQCLIPDLSVYENILLPLMLDKSRKGKASAKDTVLRLCGQFGLKEHARKYPSQLSGGQQQRAAILRAVINQPPLLLCDEPTGSLNSAQSDTVMELLQELNRKGQTILLVTHDVRVAARGSRVIYIGDGRIAGELKFADGLHPSESREEALLRFLQARGW